MMGFLLIMALCLIFFLVQVVLQQYGRIERLSGSRRELKAEIARLRREKKNAVEVD